MKVLFIHCRYKYEGGEDAVVKEEIKLLQDEGIEVELIEFWNNKNTFLKLLQLPFNFSSYQKVKRKIKEFKPNLVHVHNIHFAASASALIAVNRANIPFVTTLHNFRMVCPTATLFLKGQLFLDSTEVDFPWKAVWRQGYKNSAVITFWLAFSTWIHHKIGTYKKCRKYITLTDFSKNIFKHSKIMKGLPFETKPNFTRTPSSTVTKRQKHFLYVGRLTEEKGIGTLIEAFSLSSSSLYIVGDGPMKDFVIESCNKNSAIKYLGILSKEEVLDQMSTCTTLIFPSIWYEGMPMTILEAFAAGCPVIGSNTGAMASMIYDGINGLHFKAGIATDLRAKICQWEMISEEKKQGYYSLARQTYLDNYTPEKNLDQLLAIYNHALNDRNKPKYHQSKRETVKDFVDMRVIYTKSKIN